MLDYFFTNLDKPVFFAKNFHPEVWALMQARYSRSTKGLREGFLELLKEDPVNFDQLSQALSNKQNSAQMQSAVDKAIQFMEKWVLGYGHSSVAEGAIVGAGFEGVSILASKVIEDNRLASYIEKSTRYVKFDRSSFYIDPLLKESEYGNEVESLVNELFETYENLSKPVLEYVKSTVPLKAGEDESAWKRACAARRFDSVRYLLPACTKTSLGWTVNARALAHGISKMLSHPLPEMQELGKLTREEGKIVLPSLLKYADEKKFFIETEKAMPTLTHGYVDAQQFLGDPALPIAEPVELVSYSDDADNLLVASILYRYSHLPFEKMRSIARNMQPADREKIWSEFCSRISEFDYPLRELEHVSLTFDVLVDYGAFRDIQRHRVMTQTNQLLTTFHGYDTPPDIVAAGCAEQYTIVMQKADKLFRKLYPSLPYHAQYVVPLAYRKRVLMTMNLRELYHFVKLRSTPAGHYSYRLIARLMYDAVKRKFPLLSQYLICHLSNDDLGRLQAEQKLEEKIKKGLI